MKVQEWWLAVAQVEHVINVLYILIATLKTFWVFWIDQTLESAAYYDGS